MKGCRKIIDIIVVDIPESYGLLLCKDWSTKLVGYFAIHWSYIWLPYKVKQNKIRVDQERYMKHLVMELNYSNEIIMFHNSILDNYHLDMYFKTISIDVPFLAKSYKQSETLHCTEMVELHCNIVDCSFNNKGLGTKLSLLFF